MGQIINDMHITVKATELWARVTLSVRNLHLVYWTANDINSSIEDIKQCKA